MPDAPVQQQQAAPDAVLYHESMKRGATSAQRLQAIQKVLGPRLGGSNVTSLGPQFGGRVYSRDVGGGWYLATLSAGDTLLFPTDHDYARMPRYRWEDQPDGTKHGWLLSPEEVEAQAHAEAPAATTARKAALARWKERQDANCQKLARWRELAPLGKKRTPEQDAEMAQLQVELFGDPALVNGF